jgi:hypothetical protein
MKLIILGIALELTAALLLTRSCGLLLEIGPDPSLRGIPLLLSRGGPALSPGAARRVDRSLRNE